MKAERTARTTTMLYDTAAAFDSKLARKSLSSWRDKPNLRRKGFRENISMRLRSSLTDAFQSGAMPKSTSWQKLILATFVKALITPRFAGCAREEIEKLGEPFPLPSSSSSSSSPSELPTKPEIPLSSFEIAHSIPIFR